MLDPKNIKPGEEQYERYYCTIGRQYRYQYDYRNIDGTLFSCTRTTLQLCRQARDKWLESR